ncbi:hypothetical protein CABS01_14089 [Colletotrichum abscissum]|uniref:uncharacterized protein n=1 Tax=Colletotrichum abscissum TaxID=1671311 RepID=UPI0027D709E4|nr:uncharacterized protein CABS01_14089 [Colletotrichum abscissum]KAK1482391.1 hypothetical protein CABS01_14089 [Colletotrichum abscissum]
MKLWLPRHWNFGCDEKSQHCRQGGHFACSQVLAQALRGPLARPRTAPYFICKPCCRYGLCICGVFGVIVWDTHQNWLFTPGVVPHDHSYQSCGIMYVVWLILNHIKFGPSLRLHGSLCNQGTGSGSIRHCHKLAEEEAPNPEASKELHLRANDGGRRRKSQPNGPNPPLGGCIQAPTYRRQSGNGC